MADPVSLGVIAGVGAITGAASSIFGGYTQAGNYNAQVQALDYQAQMQETQAKQISMNGTSRQNLQQQEASKVAGTQRAAIGQSNLAMSGTMQDVVDESNAKALLDKYNIAYDTEVQSTSALDQASISRYQANVARSNAKNSVIGGYIGAAGSALSGVGNYIGWSRLPTAK